MQPLWCITCYVIHFSYSWLLLGHNLFPNSKKPLPTMRFCLWATPHAFNHCPIGISAKPARQGWLVLCEFGFVHLSLYILNRRLTPCVAQYPMCYVGTWQWVVLGG